MIIKGWTMAALPPTAEEGDNFVDLSTGAKRVYRCGEWVDPAVRPDLPVATADKAGVIKVGAGLTATAGVLAVNVATESAPGMVQVGSGLDVTESGVLSTEALPVATTTTPGIMQVGTGLAVTDAGVVSISGE